jgi:hypothetical protein
MRERLFYKNMFTFFDGQLAEFKMVVGRGDDICGIYEFISPAAVSKRLSPYLAITSSAF